MTEQNSPWQDIGGLSPDEAEDLHVQRLARQRIDEVTADQTQKARRKPRRGSSVQDPESDRDHADKMAATPPNFVAEPDEGEPIKDPKLVARLIARRALSVSMAKKLGKNSPQYRKWLESHNREHPLDTYHQEGA